MCASSEGSDKTLVMHRLAEPSMVTLCDNYQKARVLAKVVCPLNNGCSYKLDGNSTKKKLTLKAPIMTAADNKFCNIFPDFLKK